jgi:hypothetical protein
VDARIEFLRSNPGDERRVIVEAWMCSANGTFYNCSSCASIKLSAAYTNAIKSGIACCISNSLVFKDDAKVDWLAFETLPCCIQLVYPADKLIPGNDGICWPDSPPDDIVRLSDLSRKQLVKSYFDVFAELGWINPLVFAHGGVALDALGFSPQPDLPLSISFGISNHIPDITVLASVHEAFIMRHLNVACLEYFDLLGCHACFEYGTERERV